MCVCVCGVVHFITVSLLGCCCVGCGLYTVNKLMGSTTSSSVKRQSVKHQQRGV
eukprot:m.128397 g.128397  ORF g.128397 m.128397 type:complete len:54 (-) comp29333_c0_seq1:879-1040(-)